MAGNLRVFCASGGAGVLIDQATRRDLDLSADFVASVEANGILVPLRVTRDPGGGYRVIDGHRRLAAVKTGLAEVPADLAEERAGDEPGQYLDMWTSHRHRAPLSLTEEADALFAAHEAGASKTRIRRSTGLKAPQVGVALAAGRLSGDTRETVEAISQELWTSDTEPAELLGAHDGPVGPAGEADAGREDAAGQPIPQPRTATSATAPAVRIRPQPDSRHQGPPAFVLAAPACPGSRQSTAPRGVPGEPAPIDPSACWRGFLLTRSTIMTSTSPPHLPGIRPAAWQPAAAPGVSRSVPGPASALCRRTSASPCETPAPTGREDGNPRSAGGEHRDPS